MFTYLEEYGIKIRKVDDALGKEALPYTYVESFNHANVKRLDRKLLRKMLESKHSSRELKSIVVNELDNTSNGGLFFTERKRSFAPIPMVSLLR